MPSELVSDVTVLFLPRFPICIVSINYTLVERAFQADKS
jgi:hypothetical protein